MPWSIRRTTNTSSFRWNYWREWRRRFRRKSESDNKNGEDVTAAFVNGAYKALEQIKDLHPEYIILKERSPSCGSSTIYTGEFNGNKQTGFGVTTALFKRHGFKVISEEEFENKKELTLFVNSFLSVLFHT